MFALASTWHHHSRDCESVESIAIARAIRRRVKTLRSLFANFAVSLRSLWQFAEVITVAFCNLVELLQSLSKFAADYHGRFRKHMASSQMHLQFAESFKVAYCNSRNSSRLFFCEAAIISTTLARLQGKGEHDSSRASSWQRQMASSLKGCLNGCLGGL